MIFCDSKHCIVNIYSICKATFNKKNDGGNLFLVINQVKFVRNLSCFADLDLRYLTYNARASNFVGI